jgi:hypothetical protein
MAGVVSALIRGFAKRLRASTTNGVARTRRAPVSSLPCLSSRPRKPPAVSPAPSPAIYKIVSGIQNDNLFEALAEEIEEGRALFKRRVSPELYPRNFYDRALVDILKAKGHIKSKLW